MVALQAAVVAAVVVAVALSDGLPIPSAVVNVEVANQLRRTPLRF